MTRLLENTPAYCVGCYQQDTSKRHVDFEAAYDGPVIPGTPANIPVDDLILCEGCLAEAFALLDPEGLHQEIERLVALLTRAGEDIEAKDRMIQRLEKTAGELVQHPIERRGGSQSYAGVPQEIRILLNERRQKENEKRKVKA